MDTKTEPHPARKNHLLAALPTKEFERLERYLEPTSFKLGEVIHEADQRLDSCYFPTTSIISLLYIMQNGATAEIGVVGNDGVLGVALFMGGDTTPNRAVVQSAGDAFKVEAKVIQG